METEHKWKFLIFCDFCMVNFDGKIEVFLAKYGRVDRDDEEGNILVCRPWWARDPMDEGNKYFCDECHRAVVVHPSSQWFIDAHREERNEYEASS